jgi:hypothetical protein
MKVVERATTIARDIRTELLRLKETPRNLAGECGLAAMLAPEAQRQIRVNIAGRQLPGTTTRAAAAPRAGDRLACAQSSAAASAAGGRG